ncbi:probable ATP-binding protein PRP16 [Fusarium fujikuroi]|nr:probable ATP-binding protein PRP16 [Fusarium fujikuroi]SCN99419.1 probable ATP-binding protein PRP16 [Fusarium fujikuroi]
MEIHESVIFVCRIKSLLWQSGNYACITIDEAHERTTNTDMLLALLKKLIHRRKDPKPVIMSATINLENGLQTKYVEEPPTCYDSAAVMLVKQFVANKRKGNVLVFLTSVRDIEKTCAMFRREVRGLKVLPMYSSLPKHAQDLATGGSTSQVTIVVDECASGLLVACTQPRVVAATGVATGVATLVAQKMDVPSGSIVGYKVRFDKQSSGATRLELLTNGLLLQQYAGHSTVETRLYHDQWRPRENDNTDILLALPKKPDFGKHVEARFNCRVGMGMLATALISKASARQRAGCAGRTQPGECIRLYTKEFHDLGMTSNSPAGIHMSDVSGQVLLLKSLGFQNVPQFDWNGSPHFEAYLRAIGELKDM